MLKHALSASAQLQRRRCLKTVMSSVIRSWSMLLGLLMLNRRQSRHLRCSRFNTSHVLSWKIIRLSVSLSVYLCLSLSFFLSRRRHCFIPVFISLHVSTFVWPMHAVATPVESSWCDGLHLMIARCKRSDHPLFWIAYVYVWVSWTFIVYMYVIWSICIYQLI